MAPASQAHGHVHLPEGLATVALVAQQGRFLAEGRSSGVGRMPRMPVEEVLLARPKASSALFKSPRARRQVIVGVRSLASGVCSPFVHACAPHGLRADPVPHKLSP